MTLPATLFAGLLDDAALFPPGSASMAAAVPAHRQLKARWGAPVGPFVVPSSRLGELAEHADGDPLGIALICPAAELPDALGTVASIPGLRLETVEVPVVADATAARDALRRLDGALPATVGAALELPRTPQRDGVIAALAGTRYRAKLRTGGVVPEAFPDDEELAAGLAACVRAGVALKCTAGLHRPVRHVDPDTGFSHHGFLNVLLAVDALLNHAPVARDWLAENDDRCLAEALRGWSPRRVGVARAVFTSFGTCSVAEPLEELVRLRLLPALAAA